MLDPYNENHPETGYAPGERTRTLCVGAMPFDRPIASGYADNHPQFDKGGGHFSFGASPRVARLLLRQCSVRRDFLSVRVHVVDIERPVGIDKSRAGRSAGELMHVFARHHGVTARAEEGSRFAVGSHGRRNVSIRCEWIGAGPKAGVVQAAGEQEDIRW